jgi:gliding motility-associated lipoprotein GldD
MKNNLFILTLIAIVISGCSNEPDYEFYPKPLSGQKIVFPEREYKTYTSNCNYSFDIPYYSAIDTSKGNCNADLILPPFNATLFITYLNLDTNLMYNIEYSRKLAYDHSIKADAIEEAVVKNPDNKVYGMQYKIIGDAASQYQFYVTDSVDNFLRGALYFNVKPNYDSLKPSLNYIMTDFEHLIKSIKWNNE